jgi:uncharacterized protein
MIILKISRFIDASMMLSKVESFLLNEEHLNNLMLGLLYRLRDTKNRFNDLYLVIENDDEQLIMLISGLYLILYANTLKIDIYENAVIYLEENKIDYPGIIGPNDICDIFNRAYQKVTKKPLAVEMSQRIYVCSKTNPIDDEIGKIQLANPKDQDLLIPWMVDFLVTTNEDASLEASQKRLSELIKNEQLYLLVVDDQVVSMAATTRPFRKTISIGYVYTPIGLRNRGFATKMVKSLTDLALEKYDFCSLYTDLANPTSNSIYQKIGYQPIGDSIVYKKHHG